MHGQPTVWYSRFADQFKNWLMRLKLVGRWANCTVSKQILILEGYHHYPAGRGHKGALYE
jgi:hypothetical protein